MWVKKERKGDLEKARVFAKENNYTVFHFPKGTSRNAFADAKKQFISDMRKEGIKFCKND